MWKKGGSLHGGGGGDKLIRKGNNMVAVAIDKDKNSQHALKWTIEHLLTRGQTVVLIHVEGLMHRLQSSNNTKIKPKTCSSPSIASVPIQCLDVILEDTNIAKKLTEYANYAAIEILVLGASSRHGFIRFRSSDVPSHVMKSAPDFCTVYVISKAKISTAKKSSKSAPFPSPLREKMEELSNNNFGASVRRKDRPEKTAEKPLPVPEDPQSIESPFNQGRGLNAKSLCGELSDADISFVSSGRPSTGDRMSAAAAMYYDISSTDLGPTPRLSTSSDRTFESLYYGNKGPDTGYRLSSSSRNNKGPSSSRTVDDVDSEMRRLKMELEKTMEMYSTACKDALTAKQKAGELEQWRVEEANRLEEATSAKQEAREVAEKEKERYRALMAKARASRRIAEIESEKRALEHPEEKQQESHRYRRYTIDEIEKATDFFDKARKIGEGGYGPVFKGRLDNTVVAIKVLRPDAAQGRSQFQQEVEVLSCMRHPNMVLLLGACPEYGCLVYEYMANGSLEDRLLRRGNTPPLSWQIRFKIAAEIATGILFLHQTKPEPIVHRDLKPGNILLDRNFVSKISDVGLARLIPASSVADDVTQYRMTSAAGTMCYIDPEYQQTGLLGVKSDVYSLGIMLLQLITARPAMGLTHHVRRAIGKGTFGEMLDPTVTDWPIEEALGFAKLSIQCAELRRKDRPDLGKELLPELNRLRDLGVENMTPETSLAQDA
ncbi:hypothetical protein L2E82_07609 [Cichorium intybus]|uniref:Uncharacterized protein n=1 Tax=Cichorium intybus TaxID=13427 RepID=A0ACB9G4M9_CICIN|nr:hypothetical protein L2E82_07609 [Cichorium intybus]